jgi:hypothetical protein
MTTTTHRTSLDQPRKGDRFEHARHRQYVPGVRVADSPFVVMVVTAVQRRNGLTFVYYTDADVPNPRKGRLYSELSELPNVVGRWLSTSSDSVAR